MARYIVTLDGFDICNLLEGDEITFSFTPDPNVKEVVIKLTPNAVQNLNEKSLFERKVFDQRRNRKA